ncbi:MAG: hypothetical protein J6U17_01250 [Kiritimatiellae bacterium]|nr:hypothetical protein [Kiritimatiellia bacterium]
MEETNKSMLMAKICVAKCIAALGVFLIAYRSVFAILWKMHMAYIPNPEYAGLYDRNAQFVYAEALRCTTQNCIAYAFLALVVAGLLQLCCKGKRLSTIAQSGWWAAFAVNFICASMFCLQLLLTESVADCVLGLAWVDFIAPHLTGLVCLCLLSLLLYIFVGKERRLLWYALFGCLVYALMFLYACVMPLSLVAFRGGMVAGMCVPFVAFTLADLRAWKVDGDVACDRMGHCQKMWLFLACVVLYGGYLSGISFWREYGRKDGNSFVLEERFLRERAPHSIQALRTGICTERDKIRTRINNTHYKPSESWLDFGLEIMTHPLEYGADPTVTNALHALSRDEHGNAVKGAEVFVDVAHGQEEAVEANAEFAENLRNMEGKLSEIPLPGAVVDRIAERAMSRVRHLDMLPFPLNLFVVYTRGNGMTICRVGRDVFYRIKVFSNGADSNIIPSETINGFRHGPMDLNINEIVAFSAYHDRLDVLMNEVIGMTVVLHVFDRMFGYTPPFDFPWREYFERVTNPEEAECIVQTFVEGMLTEEEVDELRVAFIEAVNKKRPLSPTKLLTIVEDNIKEILLILSIVAIYAPRSKWIAWTEDFRPRSRWGVIGLTLLAIICILATLQVKKYLAMWASRKTIYDI